MAGKSTLKELHRISLSRRRLHGTFMRGIPLAMVALAHQGKPEDGSGPDRVTAVRESLRFCRVIHVAPNPSGIAARQLSDKRDVVIFDMPPLAYDDVLSFAPRVDCVLLVIAEGRTERAALTKAKELIAEMKLVGVVLNCSTEPNGKSYCC